MNAIDHPRSQPTKLLDYQQLSDWLNDSVRHLRRLVAENKIPYLKVGHYIRFDPAQIARWLDAHHHDPAA